MDYKSKDVFRFVFLTYTNAVGYNVDVYRGNWVFFWIKCLSSFFFILLLNILYKLLLKLEYFVIETMIKTKITIQS